MSAERDAARRLADAVRDLVQQVATTAPPADALDHAADAVRRVTESLRAVDPGIDPRFPVQGDGVRDPASYFSRSPVAGPLNPLAAPFEIEVRDGEAHATVTFGRAYQGPPGYVHGGFVAAAFDEVLGMANAASGNPGMTGRLEIRYRRPTPLDTPLHLVGRHTGREGRKILASATLAVGEEVTAEAFGVFIEITPSRARELFGHDLRSGSSRSEPDRTWEEVDHGAAL